MGEAKRLLRDQAENAKLRAQRDQARAALSHIYNQYIINRGDMTDAEALRVIKVLAGDALNEETENVG